MTAHPIAIGVDIGGTHLRVARVGADGAVLAHARAASSPDPAVVLARCLGLIAELGTGDATAVGVGVPGQVGADRRILSGGFVNFAGVDLAARIEAATGLAATIENDGTMALIAEAACGAARGMANVVLLTIGTGIGGAVLAEGRILRGRGPAGQLGHVAVDPEGPGCVCGRRGCVETFSSGTALGRRIAAAGFAPGTRADDLLARAAAGDTAAARTLADWAGPLRMAIDTLAATCAPDVALLGGGLGRAALAALQRLPAAPSWFATPVLAAALGDDAGVVGAGLAALGAFGAPPAVAPKRVVLVNGVPASGKTSVARAVAAATGWPVLSLDTIKDPFLAQLGAVDRGLNRRLGQASYAAIFAVLGDAPAGATAIVDAWFGFQPPEVLEAHLAAAGIARTAEIWCEAPPETVAARYAARIGERPAGHPGAEYLPELVALAGRATPLARGPMTRVDTTTPLDLGPLLAWVATALRDEAASPGERINAGS